VVAIETFDTNDAKLQSFGNLFAVQILKDEVQS
jgi:hypothetical protein